MDTMEQTSSRKNGLLQKAQRILADVTPDFSKWAKRSGFKRAAILSPCTTADGDFYYMTDNIGFTAKGMARLTQTKKFWEKTIAKAFEWQCFSKDFNEIEKFDGLFDDDVYVSINKIFFLPFKDKQNPLIFVLVESDDDNDIHLAEAPEMAVILKNIVEFKNQRQKLLKKFTESIDNGFEISNGRLYILSIKVAVEFELAGIEIPGDELKRNVIQSITESSHITIDPLFRTPNCSNPGLSGEIKVVLFTNNEEDEQLLAYHAARTLSPLLSEESEKNILLLPAGVCKSKKDAIDFLFQE